MNDHRGDLGRHPESHPHGHRSRSAAGGRVSLYQLNPTKPRYTFRDVFISQFDGAKFYLFALDGHATLMPVSVDWFWGRK